EHLDDVALSCVRIEVDESHRPGPLGCAREDFPFWFQELKLCNCVLDIRDCWTRAIGEFLIVTLHNNLLLSRKSVASCALRLIHSAAAGRSRELGVQLICVFTGAKSTRTILVGQIYEEREPSRSSICGVCKERVNRFLQLVFIAVKNIWGAHRVGTNHAL